MVEKRFFGLIVPVLLLAASGFAETVAATAGGAQQVLVCPHCGQTYTGSQNAEPVTVAPVEEPNPVTTADAAPATNNWKMTVYGGFSAKSGNTVEQSYKYGGEFEKKDDQFYRYKLKLDGKYGKTEKQVTDSKSEASGEMRRMFRERWFNYGTLSVLHDNLRDISYRAKIGPGVGYYFVDTDALVADLSSGPLYVLEKGAGSDSGYLAWRVAQWFDWNITQTFRWWVSTEAVVDTAACIVTFKTGVDSKINDHLSLVVSIEDDYDSMPETVGNIKKNDFEISTGLRYHL